MRRATGEATFFITAELVDHPGVRRLVAVPADETFEDLHHLLRRAFEWEDDHLYSFWLDGQFWGDPASELTSPIEAEPGARTADVPIGTAGLSAGREVAYLFDFGDEWRVRLHVDEIRPGQRGKGRVLRAEGDAPPQYPPLAEDE
jgi:hypothetical protein